jgi:predicted dehydrogenase
MAGTLRVAVIGAGYFSQFHVEAWTGMDSVAEVFLCDHDLARARALAGRFGVSHVHTDAAQMLADNSVDLVDIVTPPATHLSLVNLALRHGLPVVCQKALAPTAEEAERIVAAAERANLPLIVHENFRFSPWYREARRLIGEGTLGTLHSVAFRLRPGDGQGVDAYLARQPYFQQMPRFLVFETAIHFIDTFRYLLGEVEAVTARLRRINPDIAGEDAGYIIFEFAGGATGLFDGNRLNDHSSDNPRRTMGEMWLEGSRGVLRLDGMARLWWKPHHAGEVEHAYDKGPETFAGGTVRKLNEHVARFLRGEGPAENTGRAYLENIRIQDAVYHSHASGTRVDLRPSAQAAADRRSHAA